MEDNEILEKEFLKIREDFKFFENNKEIIYLDSAAMTQKPNCVLEDVLNYYNNKCANVGRSLNKLDIQNREYIDTLRKDIISFLNLKELNKEYKRPIIRMITRDMCAVCSSSSLGIVSFNVEGIESIEIAQILSDNNIYVRENNDCMNIQKQSIRVSLGIYNTKQDIDIFIQTLKKIIDYYL